jgi:hypothetical protein
MACLGLNDVWFLVNKKPGLYTRRALRVFNGLFRRHVEWHWWWETEVKQFTPSQWAKAGSARLVQARSETLRVGYAPLMIAGIKRNLP